MALDADLGIDSIKRVEILSALKEAVFPKRPSLGPDQLGQFQTLGDIVAFLTAQASATRAPRQTASAAIRSCPRSPPRPRRSTDKPSKRCSSA